jgi:hypothetical protein
MGLAIQFLPPDAESVVAQVVFGEHSDREEPFLAE